MAGCFGNSPIDRHLENQLNRHLDKEAEWDNFCEKVFEECDKIDHILADSADFDIYWNSEECSKLLNQDKDICFIANEIINGFIQTTKRPS